MDLTYFDGGTPPNSYNFIDAINSIGNGVKTLEEATDLWYDNSMWQWFGVYNLLVNKGITVFPEQPNKEDLKDSLSEYFRTKFKAARTEQVKKSTITFEGNVYDADEEAQGRLAVAMLSAIDDVETTIWVLHDNTTVHINRIQIQKILRACTLQMSSIWVP